MYKPVKFITEVPYRDFSTFYLFNKSDKILLPLEIGRETSAPSIHDSLIRVIKGIGYTILCLKIYRHVGGNFYAYLTIKNKEKILDINISFKDGLEICKKSASPIFVNKNILELHGVEITKELVFKALKDSSGQFN